MARRGQHKRKDAIVNRQQNQGYRRGNRRHRKVKWRNVLLLMLAVIFIVSLVRLISYAADYVSAKRAEKELREIYYAYAEHQTPSPSPAPTLPPTATPGPTFTPAPTVPSVSLLTPTPAREATGQLPSFPYPENPQARVSSRFQKIQRQNEDIIGWLTIPDLMDQAVVQRDNSYYLRRDYRGYHNTNGAIFLDESCNLQTRPYTLILYGHNMKTGAMFGCLRNYESLYFYQQNPFINFDTAYEDGKYVIFSVATVSIEQYDRQFVHLAKLNSDWASWRQEELDALRKLSIFSSRIDVQPEDQLLLLVTCVEDDSQRRIVAARRIREGESAYELQSLANQAKIK